MEEFQRLLHMVPREVEVVALRSDTAGYQTEILRFCNENWNKRFKRIYYGISAEINAPFRKAAKAVPEENWKPLKTCKGEHGETIVLQEWAEVVYVPNNLATKKHGPDYRFFAIREKWNGEWKDADKETTPEENPACGRQLFLEGTIQALEEENGRMKKLHLSEFGGGIYKLFGVASNIEDGIDGKPFGLASGEKMDGAAIITWQRKRCGKSEEVNHSLKEELAGGHVPSKYFGAISTPYSSSTVFLKSTTRAVPGHCASNSTPWRARLYATEDVWYSSSGRVITEERFSLRHSPNWRRCRSRIADTSFPNHLIVIHEHGDNVSVLMFVYPQFEEVTGNLQKH
jgi:hypothetical protein